MPIDEDEWEEGRSAEAIEYKILDFLRKNKPKAYSFDELRGRFGKSKDLETVDREDFFQGLNQVMMDIADTIKINDALDQLIEEGKVERREIEQDIGTETYYRAK